MSRRKLPIKFFLELALTERCHAIEESNQLCLQLLPARESRQGVGVGEMLGLKLPAANPLPDHLRRCLLEVENRVRVGLLEIAQAPIDFDQG